MARRILAVSALVLAALTGGAEALTPSAMEPRQSVVLQGLDKITARVWTFEAALDQPMAFGTLRITVRTCRQAPPIDPPESAAFLEITEERTGEETMALFRGWMFASSPALSALEHPVYDVWVLGCGAQ